MPDIPVRLVPDHILVAITLWAECRGEPWDGQIAVAEVIRNRTVKKHFSDGTVASTILWPYQFSCWNTKDPNRAKMFSLLYGDKLVEQCIRAWNEAVAGSEFTKGALFYVNLDALTETPSWVGECVQTVKIHRHRFYKLKAKDEAKEPVTNSL